MLSIKCLCYTDFIKNEECEGCCVRPEVLCGSPFSSNRRNDMLKIREYVKVKDLEEAYQLNQKRSACVLGGMVWLKMGNRNVCAIP